MGKSELSFWKHGVNVSYDVADKEKRWLNNLQDKTGDVINNHTKKKYVWVMAFSGQPLTWYFYF